MEKITDYRLLTNYNSQRCATVQFVNICNFGATCCIAFLLNVYLNVCCLCALTLSVSASHGVYACLRCSMFCGLCV